MTNNHGVGFKNKKVINSGGTAHSQICAPKGNLFNQWVPKFNMFFVAPQSKRRKNVITSIKI